MKAMIFAAGIGSRLKELTRDTPKCLMQVGDKTMLEHVVDRLKSAGVSGLAINVHHHADKVTRFLRDKDNFGLEVLVSHESSLLDTGGGLKKVASFFGNEDAFLIHNADIFSTVDLAGLVHKHRSRNAIGTLAVMVRPSQRGLYFDSAHHLVGWTGEKNPPPSSDLLSFCGISVASSEIFSHMGSEDVFSIIKTFITAARSTGRVWGEVVSGADWTDIGTPEQLEALRKRVAGHSVTEVS
jgi:N-acetyl-alpha-D-muramate 1-phosphate uridylyltransferase